MLAPCLLLALAAARPPMAHPKAASMEWIHRAKEVDEEVKHPVHHRHARSASLLSEKAQVATGGTKILRELGAAQRAIAQELKDAPQQLRHEEFELLSKAEDAANDATQLKAGRKARKSALLQRVQRRTAKYQKAKAATKVSAAEELRRSGRVLHKYVKDMHHQAREEKKLLKMATVARKEAAEALSEEHADAATRKEVAGLMSFVEKAEGKVAKMSADSAAQGKEEEARFAAMAKRA